MTCPLYIQVDKATGTISAYTDYSANCNEFHYEKIDDRDLIFLHVLEKYFPDPMLADLEWYRDYRANRKTWADCPRDKHKEPLQ